MEMMLEQFKTIFDRPEKVKRLREAILDLAVRGKLVEQDPNDEPASVLLERIKEEKERLVKEKKIKKEKPLAEIGEEEKPFGLPEGWEWIRLGNIGDWGAGATPSRGNSDYYGGNINWLKTGELNDGIVGNSEEKITELALDKCSLRLNKPGDVLIAMYGATIGKLGILNCEATTNQACCGCTPFDGISNKYLFTLLMAMRSEFRSQGAGGAQPNISRQKIVNTVISIPPVEEQKRIVEKVNSLMSFCDKLEEALEKKVNYGQLSAKSVFNAVGNVSTVEELEETLRFILLNFKDLSLGDNAVKELKNCILQLAVQGKLVPQNPEDEPAKVLLEKIKEEKVRLVAEGKIKKEKALAEIREEEKAFELPRGWEWIRLGEYCLMNPRNNVDDTLDTSFIPMKLINDGFANKHTYEIRSWKEIKSGFTHFAEEDIVVAKITPCFENRKSAIMKDLLNGIGAGTTELYVVRCIENTILPKYILSIFKTEKFIRGGVETYTGTAGQQRVKKDYINNLVIALPPLAEQKRIVEKVDALMVLCDELEKKIQKQKEYSARLMEAVLKGAF